MIRVKLFTLLVAAIMLGLGAGCASTPQASPAEDSAAKQFLTHPNASTIYVYRSQFNHLDTDTVLYVDGRLIGATRPGTYFRLDVNPGRHVLHGNGIDLGEYKLDTRPGLVYFVSLTVTAGRSQYRLVSDRVGQQDVVACCALLENWWPGQRPFLR